MSDITDYQMLLDKLCYNPFSQALQKMQEREDIIAKQLERTNCISLNSDVLQYASKIDFFEEMSYNLDRILNQTLPNLDESFYPMQSILNLPSISDYLRAPALEEFYSSYEQLMRTLDFPVIQPEITREQLEKRLEQMDEAEFNTIKENLVKIADTIPLQQKEKNDFKEKVRKVWNATKKVVAVLAAADAILSMGERTANFIEYVSSKIESHITSTDITEDANSNDACPASCNKCRPFVATITTDITDYNDNRQNSEK